MDISYLGHACFKLRGKESTVVTDPYSSKVGFALPRVSADIVTMSHDHEDHANVSGVSGTSRREKPFIIDTPGEYEIGGVGVFGFSTYHDNEKGEKRGKNIVFSILIDGVSVVHLGDLGHVLSTKQVSELNGVDVLICPVGGHYTIEPDQINELISLIEPSIFIPMHYKTNKHSSSTFGDLLDIEKFLEKISKEAKREEKLVVSKASLPEEMEVVILES